MGLLFWKKSSRDARAAAAPGAAPAAPSSPPPPADDDEPDRAEFELTMEEAEAIVAGAPDPAIGLVDVREQWEWDAQRFDGALHVPLGTVERRLGELKEFAARHDRVVVYCQHGMRSLNATAFLKEAGIDSARSLPGGLAVWASAAGPGRVRSGGGPGGTPGEDR